MRPEPELAQASPAEEYSLRAWWRRGQYVQARIRSIALEVKSAGEGMLTVRAVDKRHGGNLTNRYRLTADGIVAVGAEWNSKQDRLDFVQNLSEEIADWQRLHAQNPSTPRTFTFGLRSNGFHSGALSLLARIPEVETIENTWTLFGFGDRALLHLARLKHLRSLDLHMTDVSDAGLRHLSSLPRLENLDLSSTGISDRGLAHLQRLPNLKRLCCTGTGVTEDGVRKFRSALPDCEVIWEPDAGSP